MNISTFLNFIKNSGLKYIFFRIYYELMRKTGLLKKAFPINASNHKFITLADWKIKAKPFFFKSSEDVPVFLLHSDEIHALSETFHDLKNGTLKLFSGTKTENAFDNWHQNPENGFAFDSKQHWTEINEFASGHGDIKYVWEKGRFCFLYTIIRYDKHLKTDNSKFAFSLIRSWIVNNRLNCGPHYKCSQEIAIRVLNWIFTLYFYRNSKSLDEDLFRTILNSIYDQSIHIQKNLKFASIAVRNNHIISEALGLYTVGMLFPWFNESENWKKTGKSILESEGLYQIYEDGSYLQHSHNYHRVVLQLYTWAFRIANVNNDQFSNLLKDRLQLSVNFLHSMQNEYNGRVPNYGANDGSLFFPLNSCCFNDYRPQIDALNFILSNTTFYDKGKWNEDLLWYGIDSKNIKRSANQLNRILSFTTGGYFILQSNEMKSIIRCASFRHRPSHSDNLHLDLWFNGSNIICDRGSFSYNTDHETLAQFVTSPVHNTVSIDKYDQMLKGPRFIWFHWTDSIYHEIAENDNYTSFSGAIKAFCYINKKYIIHHRIVKQYKESVKWEIIDKIETWSRNITQYWNIGENFYNSGFSLKSTDGNGKLILPEYQDGYFSETYGVRSLIRQVFFTSESNIIHTVIAKV